MPYIQTRHPRRLENLLADLCRPEQPQSAAERRIARKLWRSVTNAFHSAGIRAQEHDIHLLEEAVTWRVLAARYSLLMKYEGRTCESGGPQETYSEVTANSAQSYGGSNANSSQSHGKVTAISSHNAAEKYARACERYRRVMKDLLPRIPQKPSEHKRERGLADILAPIIEEAKDAIEASIIPYDGDEDPCQNVARSLANGWTMEEILARARGTVAQPDKPVSAALPRAAYFGMVDTDGDLTQCPK